MGGIALDSSRNPEMPLRKLSIGLSTEPMSTTVYSDRARDSPMQCSARCNISPHLQPLTQEAAASCSCSINLCLRDWHRNWNRRGRTRCGTLAQATWTCVARIRAPSTAAHHRLAGCRRLCSPRLWLFVMGVVAAVEVLLLLALGYRYCRATRGRRRHDYMCVKQVLSLFRRCLDD